MEANELQDDDELLAEFDEHDERDYRTIFRSITPEERAAFDADRAAFNAEQGKPGEQFTFEHHFKLPDGSSIRAADIRAEHIAPIVAALPDGDYVTALALAYVERPLAQGLDYESAMLARWVALDREQRETASTNAAKLAAFLPRPPLPDEGIDYRAELESMDDREREAAGHIIRVNVEKLIFECAPGDTFVARRAVKLEDLDGIEALNPVWGSLFDQVRPRMAQGLTYGEAVVSIALKNTRLVIALKSTRRAIARGERQ